MEDFESLVKKYSKYFSRNGSIYESYTDALNSQKYDDTDDSLVLLDKHKKLIGWLLGSNIPSLTQFEKEVMVDVFSTGVYNTNQKVILNNLRKRYLGLYQKLTK